MFSKSCSRRNRRNRDGYRFNWQAVTTLKLPTTSYTGVPIETVYAQEGDINSRVFKVQLYDDRGIIDLTPYNKVILSATSENGGVYASQGEIIDGYGVCGISSEMMAAEGGFLVIFCLLGRTERITILF